MADLWRGGIMIDLKDRLIKWMGGNKNLGFRKNRFRDRIAKY